MKRFLMRAMASAGSGWVAAIDLAQLLRVTKVRVVINSRGVGSADISGTSWLQLGTGRGNKVVGLLERNDGEGITARDPPLFSYPPMTSGFDAALQSRRTLVFSVAPDTRRGITL